MLNNTKKQVNEMRMNEFWTWFKGHQNDNVLDFTKGIAIRLQNVCGESENTVWHTLVYSQDGSGKREIVFTARGGGLQNPKRCTEKLAKMAQADVRVNWDIYMRGELSSIRIKM